MITMYDSVTISQIPADAQAAAGYVDGKFANVAELRDRLPRAHILTIAVFAAHDADALDIETGDATPEQAAAWFLRQQARGVHRPCLYASASVMESQVVPAITAAGIPRSAVRLWSAHYTRRAHRCGPHPSCGLMSIKADATQYDDRALGRNLDVSLVADDFFGTAPAADWQEAIMSKLPTLALGAVDKPGHVFYVHRMQALMQMLGQVKSVPQAACVAVSGTFDAGTASGLKALQASFGLTADSVCGPKTWSVLITGSAT